jgi:hypothetical protein
MGVVLSVTVHNTTTYDRVEHASAGSCLPANASHQQDGLCIPYVSALSRHRGHLYPRGYVLSWDVYDIGLRH